MDDKYFKSITIIIHNTPYQKDIIGYICDGGFEPSLEDDLYGAFGYKDNLEFTYSDPQETFDNSGDVHIEVEISERVINE